MTLTDLDNPKTLLKLISIRACELAHKVGAKLVADFSKWDEYQHYDIYSMAKAYYENFANQTFRLFINKCSGPTKDFFHKIHMLNMKCVILDDGEYFREIIN